MKSKMNDYAFQVKSIPIVMVSLTFIDDEREITAFFSLSLIWVLYCFMSVCRGHACGVVFVYALLLISFVQQKNATKR